MHLDPFSTGLIFGAGGSVISFILIAWVIAHFGTRSLGQWLAGL